MSDRPVTDLGIGSWPHRRARIDPDRPALRQADVTLTYRQLADRVDQVAAGFGARGVRAGDRIAYLGANDIAGFETFFAAGRLGAVFVPLNTRLAEPELAVLLADCEPALLVYGGEQAETASRLRHEVPGVPAWIPAAELDALRRDGTLRSDGTVPETGVTLDDDAVILYTSGTTGRPKGAVLTHGNLTFNAMNQLAHADVLTGDAALCIAPLFHAVGLSQVSLPTLFKGGCVVVLPRFDPAIVLRAIAELGIASFSAVPTMLQLLCDHPDFARADLSSLRYVIYGGSMVAERVAVAWQRRGVTILQGYGMTEAAPGVYLATADGARDRPTSVGVPHFFTDVTLRPVTGNPVPDSPVPDNPVPDSGERSTRGELLVRGPNVFRGYWHRPEDSAGALAGGWFHSGDVVRVDTGGWAYVVDRLKDVIISGGENIYPAEVEAALDALDGVAESAVVAVPDPRWGEVGMAFVVGTGTRTWTADDIRDALAGRLAAYKIPKYLRLVDGLPRTATGKLRKQELRALADQAEPPHGTTTDTTGRRPTP